MTREEAKTEAREFVRLILDACAKAEGFDGYRESDWSVDTEPFVSWLVPRLAEPLDRRLMTEAYKERAAEVLRIMLGKHADDDRFTWRDGPQ